MVRKIVGSNNRSYRCEDGTIIEIKAVIVIEENKLYCGYIAGSGSDQYVTDYGNKMTFEEAKTHFPTIDKWDYSLR